MDNTLPKKSKLPFIIVVVVIVLALLGGIFLLNRNKSSEPTQVIATITETPSPLPSPSPMVDKQTIKIQVLNGTGTPGQATKVAVALQNAGYNLDNITIGNSPDTLSASSISAKTGFESIATDIQTALVSDFPEIEIAVSPLVSSSAFDIVVTTGGKKFETPTRTPTPTGSATPTPTGTTGTPTPTPTPTLTPTPTP